ncbi:MAG: hypothetical protein ACT4OZ_06485 [Gemmatimonadota bacterium]
MHSRPGTKALALAFIIPFAGCGPGGERAPNDTTTESPAPPPSLDTSAILSAPIWDADLGDELLIPGPTPRSAWVILAAFDDNRSLDSLPANATVVRGLRFTMFAEGHERGEIAADAPLFVDVPDDCSAWPLVQLDGAVPPRWEVGLRTGAVLPFTSDSLPSLSSADSATLTREIARVASSAPGDTVSALSGIPYRVRGANRITADKGGHILFAEVGRVLNQEANPLTEHVLLIARRDSASRRLTLDYSERASGSEAEVESAELTFAGRLRNGDVQLLILTRYIADGVFYTILESRQGRPWQHKWTSTYAGC